MRFDLIQVGLKIGHLRFELLAMLGQDGQEFLELHAGIPRAVVQIDDLTRFGEREPETLGTQRQLEARAVACAVDPVASRRACTLRLEKAHVFIEPHGPCRKVEFPGEVGDGVGSCHVGQGLGASGRWRALALRFSATPDRLR